MATLTIRLQVRDAQQPAAAAVYDETGKLVGFAQGKRREDFTEAVLLDALFQARGCGHLSLRALVEHLRTPPVEEEV